MSKRERTRHNFKSIAPILRIDPEGPISMQAQLRARIVAAIESGVLMPGAKVPSSRLLAKELNVARNTVALAYQQLIADGHLESRERSGVYVAETRRQVATAPDRIVGEQSDKAASTASSRIVQSVGASGGFRCPPDWQHYTYPFIEGRYDRSLFPVAEWREASRLALGVTQVEEWSVDSGEADDEMLIDEIRTKLLPRRGISAERNEILITVGEQQALHLVAQLFAGPGVKAGVEEPGLPDMRQLFAMRQADVSHHAVDDQGLVVTGALGSCDLVHVSPSRQRPSGVTMSLGRRRALVQAAEDHDFLLIEDDFECEMSYLNESIPSLYSLDRNGRVIYTASLSKVLAPGVRLGYLVAPPDVVSAARRLRNLTTRRPSPNNQRIAAFFLSLGHYDTMLSRLMRVYEERMLMLRDALNHYRPLSIAIPPVSGGTAYWVKGPDNLDGDRLMQEAEAMGLLIEPARDYYADPAGRSNMFRLGVTSLPAERIRPGIERLSRLIRMIGQGEASTCLPVTMTGKQVRKALSGRSLLYKTVYGEPCTIVLHKDGAMTGSAGYANEDRDRGRWWLEGDYWCRQWDSWAFGEAARFHVAIDSDQLYWLNDDGEIVDQAILSGSGTSQS